MKKRQRWVTNASHLGVLVLVLCAAIPAASAKQRRYDPSQHVMVIAHVSLDGKSATDMSIQCNPMETGICTWSTHLSRGSASWK